MFSKRKMTAHLRVLAAAGCALLLCCESAFAFELGIIGFQFSSETHARVANAAAAAANLLTQYHVVLLHQRVVPGWATVTLALPALLLLTSCQHVPTPRRPTPWRCLRP